MIIKVHKADGSSSFRELSQDEVQRLLEEIPLGRALDFLNDRKEISILEVGPTFTKEDLHKIAQDTELR